MNEQRDATISSSASSYTFSRLPSFNFSDSLQKETSLTEPLLMTITSEDGSPSKNNNNNNNNNVNSTFDFFSSPSMKTINSIIEEEESFPLNFNKITSNNNNNNTSTTTNQTETSDEKRKQDNLFLQKLICQLSAKQLESLLDLLFKVDSDEVHTINDGESYSIDIGLLPPDVFKVVSKFVREELGDEIIVTLQDEGWLFVLFFKELIFFLYKFQ